MDLLQFGYTPSPRDFAADLAFTAMISTLGFIPGPVLSGKPVNPLDPDELRELEQAEKAEQYAANAPADPIPAAGEHPMAGDLSCALSRSEHRARAAGLAAA